MLVPGTVLLGVVWVPGAVVPVVVPGADVSVEVFGGALVKAFVPAVTLAFVLVVGIDALR